MRRREFLLGVTAVLAAGCARVPPSGAGATPTPTTTAAGPLAVGTDGTPTGELFSRLLAEALQAKGRDAATSGVGKEWRAALGHGDLAVMPGYAATLWAGLSKAESPAAGALLGELAGLLEPDVSVLAVPGVDGGLVWRVTTSTAESGVTSLSRVADWSRGRVAAVPKFAKSRADGVPGLRDVYRARFEVSTIDDPVERGLALTSGAAEIAAFRQTEFTGASDLVDLVDPQEFTLADPAVVLVNRALTEAEPERVLALAAVGRTLTTEAMRGLQARIEAGGDVGDVSRQWLRDQGLV